MRPHTLWRQRQFFSQNETKTKIENKHYTIPWIYYDQSIDNIFLMVHASYGRKSYAHVWACASNLIQNINTFLMKPTLFDICIIELQYLSNVLMKICQVVHLRPKTPSKCTKWAISQLSRFRSDDKHAKAYNRLFHF